MLHHMACFTQDSSLTVLAIKPMMKKLRRSFLDADLGAKWSSGLSLKQRALGLIPRGITYIAWSIGSAVNARNTRI